MIPAHIGVRTPVVFDTLGPFPLKRKKGWVDIDDVDAFWASSELEKHEGIDSAIGVYIIATRKGDAPPKPWYVGKTERGFRRRFLEHVKHGTAFNPVAEHAYNGHLQVFLLVRKNSTGHFAKAHPYPASRPTVAKKKRHKSIDRLEFALIGACYVKNKKLLNVSQRTFHATLHVPGFLNSAGKPSNAARLLKSMLKQR